MKPLARLLAEHATDFAAAAALGDTVSVQAAAAASPVPCVARLLWQLSAVRGSKAVLRFFPNEVANFEPVIGLLTALEAVASATSAVAASFDEGYGLWEAQYVCLIWLTLLVLIPFDLALVDTSLSGGSGGSSAGALDLPYPPIVSGLLRLLRRQLASPGSSREAAAVVLGRLVSRPDMGAALTETLDWACEVLAAPTDAPAAAFLVPGERTGRKMATAAVAVPLAWTPCRWKENCLSLPTSPLASAPQGVALALATIFKLGQRSSLLVPAARLLPLAAALQVSPLAASNALARKLTVKLVQRIGLVFLRPRVAVWRYQKPRFNMTRNLARAAAAAEAVEGSAGGIGRAVATRGELSPVPVLAMPQQEEKVAVADADAAAEAEAGEDVAASTDQLETVVEALLMALADKDTVVRWSAAKGLGRVTMRLPRDFADDVVGSVLEGFFAPGEVSCAETVSLYGSGWLLHLPTLVKILFPTGLPALQAPATLPGMVAAWQWPSWPAVGFYCQRDCLGLRRWWCGRSSTMCAVGHAGMLWVLMRLLLQATPLPAIAAESTAPP